MSPWVETEQDGMHYEHPRGKRRRKKEDDVPSEPDATQHGDPAGVGELVGAAAGVPEGADDGAQDRTDSDVRPAVPTEVPGGAPAGPDAGLEPSGDPNPPAVREARVRIAGDGLGRLLPGERYTKATP